TLRENRGAEGEILHRLHLFGERLVLDRLERRMRDEGIDGALQPEKHADGARRNLRLDRKPGIGRFLDQFENLAPALRRGMSLRQRQRERTTRAFDDA